MNVCNYNKIIKRKKSQTRTSAHVRHLVSWPNVCGHEMFSCVRRSVRILLAMWCTVTGETDLLTNNCREIHNGSCLNMEIVIMTFLLVAELRVKDCSSWSQPWYWCLCPSFLSVIMSLCSTSVVWECTDIPTREAAHFPMDEFIVLSIKLSGKRKKQPASSNYFFLTIHSS